MNKVICAEARRALHVGWIIAILGVGFSICFDSWNDLLRSLENGVGSIHYIFQNSSIGGVCRSYFLPVFSTVPFACSFCREYKDRIFPFIVAREGRKKYCVAKFILSVVSGGLVVAIGTGGLILLLSCKLPVSDGAYQEALMADKFHFWVAIHRPVAYGFIEIISGFLRGMIWSGVALCVSAYIPDAFVVTISPYLLSFCVVQVYRLLKVPDIYRLDKLMTGNTIIRSSFFTLGICAVATGAILCLLGILFYKRVRKRMEEELNG